MSTATQSTPTSLLAKFERELHNPNNFFVPLLAKAEEVTKVRRLYLAYGFLFFLAIYLIIGYAAELVCNLLGFVYPAYRSLKALESSSKDDDTKWLMYWVTFAMFSLVEFFSDWLLDWFPPYFLAKLVFLIWLSLPIESNGSYIIYHKFIRPVFIRNEYKIDEILGAAKNAVAGAAGTAMQEAKKISGKNN